MQDTECVVSITVSTSIIVPVNGCFVHMTAMRNEAWQAIKPGGLLVCACVCVCLCACASESLIIMTNNLPHL